MKKHLITLALVSFITGSVVHADILSQWTYESVTLPTTQTPTVSGILPATGSGTASGNHASSATIWSTPAGNGSLKAFSANTWSVNDYFQFQTATTGFEAIRVTWDQTRSSTGPANWHLAFSTDGSLFTPVGTYVVASASWSSATPNSTSSFAYDLSSYPALNNAASAYFRLVNDAVAATGGTSRNDNFTVLGTAVPEPSTFIPLVAGALGFGLWQIRARRRNRA